MKRKSHINQSDRARRPAGKGTAKILPALRLRRILVPLDFSGKSRQALRFALPLAEQYGGKIFLIHAVEPIYSYPAYHVELGVAAVNPRPLAGSCEQKLSALARELVPPHLRGKTRVRVGRAYHEIVKAASELKADLIVLSTRGHTGLKHVLLGSTAEQVVRHAPCSVFTVHRH